MTFGNYLRLRTRFGQIGLTAPRPSAAWFEYCKAVELVPYYFGPEIQEYIEKVRRLIIDLQLDASIITNDQDPERNERIKGRTRRMIDLSEFYETSKKLFGPYIQAHQKVGAWLAEPDAQ